MSKRTARIVLLYVLASLIGASIGGILSMMSNPSTASTWTRPQVTHHPLAINKW